MKQPFNQFITSWVSDFKILSEKTLFCEKVYAEFLKRNKKLFYSRMKNTGIFIVLSIVQHFTYSSMQQLENG